VFKYGPSSAPLAGHALQASNKEEGGKGGCGRGSSTKFARFASMGVDIQ
jgi:hypothetical protein